MNATGEGKQGEIHGNYGKESAISAVRKFGQHSLLIDQRLYSVKIVIIKRFIREISGQKSVISIIFVPDH